MQSDFDFPSYLWLPLHLVAGSVLKLGHASGPNSYMLKHYRLSGAHKDKMVPRCLPVFKVSALLITPHLRTLPPPLLHHLTCVLSFPCPTYTQPRSSSPICLSLYFQTVCHPAAFPAGFILQSVSPIGTTLAQRRAILMKSLCSEWVLSVWRWGKGNFRARGHTLTFPACPLAPRADCWFASNVATFILESPPPASFKGKYLSFIYLC